MICMHPTGDGRRAHELCAQPTRAPIAALWLAALLGLALGAPARLPAQAIESLDHFPKSMLEIRTHEGPLRFHVWIADTEARSEQGLMYQRALADDAGMLFPVEPPRAMSMWMKNTLISLDMLFINADGRVIYIKHDATPQSLDIITTPTPAAFASQRPIPVSAVLELAAGECAKRHIREGDQVRFNVKASPAAAAPGGKSVSPP